MNALLTKDALSGLLFAVIGTTAVVVARDYPFGTARAMGPGYFPIVLGALIALGGAGLFVQALFTPGGERVTGVAVRPVVLILASILAFAVLIRPAGLIIALVAVVVIGRLAGRQVRVVETLLMAAVLVAICAVLFIYGLNMPLHLLP